MTHSETAAEPAHLLKPAPRLWPKLRMKASVHGTWMGLITMAGDGLGRQRRLRDRRWRQRMGSALVTLTVVAGVGGLRDAEAEPSSRNKYEQGDKSRARRNGKPVDRNREVRFHIALRPKDPRRYDEIIAGIGQPSGRYFTREEFTAEVKPDTQELEDWLKSKGLKIDKHRSSALDLGVRGKLDKVEEALQVQFESVDSDLDPTGAYIDIADAPSLPGEVAAPVASVVGLDDLPRAVPAFRRIAEFQERDSAVSAAAVGNCAAEYPSTSDSTAWTPWQILNSYSIRQSDTPMPPSVPAIAGSGALHQGQGVVAVVGFSPQNRADPEAFWRRANIPRPWPQLTHYRLAAATNDSCGFRFEQALDVEWIGAIAPRTSAILTMESEASGTGVLDQLNLVYGNQAYGSVINISYTLTGGSSAFETSLSTAIQNLAAVRIPVIAAAGECSSACTSAVIGVPAAIKPAVGVGATYLAATESGPITTGSEVPVSARTEYVWQASHFGNYAAQRTYGKETVDVTIQGGRRFQATFLGGNQDGFTGTSFAAPIIAGIYSIATQFLGRTPPPSAATLTYMQPREPKAFNDVQLGKIAGVPATVGIDTVSGVGSPIGLEFFRALKRQYG